MSADRQPWAHVAHKGGRLGGVIAAECTAKGWKREVAKFCGNFIVDGYTVTTVYDRAEYDALLATLHTRAA